MTKFFAVILLLFSGVAIADSNALVQAVQMPAWLQRGEQKVPLRVGTELYNGDKLITGEAARVYIKTADGSIIKLGEKAQLTVGELSQQGEALFTAAIEVIKGAFRFTTAQIAKLRQRAVTIKIAGATIGIRGTDVWGKDDEEMGVISLIEGRIEVTRADKQVFVMDQPLTVYKMPKGAVPMSVEPLDPAQLATWAAETEITAPASQIGGGWKVNLLTAPDQPSALAAYDEWRDAGYDVRIQPVLKKGRWHYTLRLTGLPTQSAARQLAERLKGKRGAENPIVSR